MDYLKLIRIASDVALLSKEERKVFSELLVELKDKSIADDLQFQINVWIHEKALKMKKEIA